MLWLRVLYLSNGLAIGVLYGFVPVLLRSKGFDPALIGLTTSLGSVGFFIALPVWGHMGDVVHGPRRTLQLACIPAAIFALGLSSPLPVVAVIVCQVVLSAGGGPSLALTDAMAMPALADVSREYSRLRLLTSLGAAGGGVGCGFLYAQTSYLVAPFLYVLVMALMILAAQFVPLGRDSERRRQARQPVDGGPAPSAAFGHFGSVGEALSGRPRLLAVLTSVLLIFMGAMGSATFIGLRIADLGGGPIEIGLVNGVGSLAEAPGLVLAGWLVSRYGLRHVLAASSAGFAACVASWAVLVDPVPLLISRFASGIFFGGIIVAFVLTMAQLLPLKLQATGQTLFQAVAFGLAAIIANLAGGILYGAAGPVGVFGAAALCAALGGAIGFKALPGAVTTAIRPIQEPLAPIP